MARRPGWLQSTLDFVIDNVSILLTIGFAGYVIYRHEAARGAVDTDMLLTAILGVLGLLAVSEIVERYRRLNSIEKSVNRALAFLESRLTERPSALAFFQKPPSLDPHKLGYKTPPTFELTPRRDGAWYHYFADQFEEMWKGARPWKVAGEEKTGVQSS